ncbi:IS3 family transposase [Parafrankia sp. Ea1.12]|uniref:IS3 family transposase n=1 Tax=Parafrankia sp. Ea1.12 TaxID=573499 RepID=UPI0011BD91E5|nr:IS3 family transposase [Parafrankia sp. Ea1.12]
MVTSHSTTSTIESGSGRTKFIHSRSSPPERSRSISFGVEARTASTRTGAAGTRSSAATPAIHPGRRRCRALGEHGVAPHSARNQDLAGPRALEAAERARVLAVLHDPRFADASPAQVWATLLDKGVYLCSQRTMYRLLAERGETGDRRAQALHPPKVKPELLAAGPNEVWTWDITKLPGPQKWTSYYLYVILDVYSRYVVGWTLADKESAALAENLIAATCDKQNISPGRLTVHADHGSSMTSKPVAFLFADLGIVQSHSRPRTSNDNPYSESQFKTLKYRPGYPRRFDSIETARAWCREFFDYYNADHRHSGIGLLTPATVHHGQAETVQAARAQVLAAAYATRPDRFVRRPPTPPPLPTPAWINPPEQTHDQPTADTEHPAQ